jgi:hypothetical protein
MGREWLYDLLESSGRHCCCAYHSLHRHQKYPFRAVIKFFAVSQFSKGRCFPNPIAGRKLKEKTKMPVSIQIPLEVFGYGFIISFFMAALIKALMFIIKKVTKS